MSLILSNEHRARVEEFRRKQKTAILVLLFTDVVGSTRLKQDLGDQQAVAITLQHHAMIRELLARFPESREIDTAGDSFFVVFAKTSDAVKFALLLQTAVRKLASEIQQPIADRIGIHAGEIFIEQREGSTKPLDLFGIQVDASSRVMSLAEGGQILATRFVFDNARQLLRGGDLPEVGSLTWLSHGPYLLKGVEEPMEICEVGETDIAPLRPPADSEKAHRHATGNADEVLGWRPALQQLVPNTQWILESKLGEGAFGEVWLAHHKTLKDKCVFKFCFRADRVRSLKREVTLFKLLRERIGEHTRIVAVRDVFFDEPPYYIIMDYAEGLDLGKWIATQGGMGKILLAARLEIVAQLADALQAAHEAGIIHRDVKPSNIIVCGNYPGVLSVKLTDFGIGQVTSPDLLAGMTRLGFTHATATGTADTGTPMYLAPELLAGKPASTRSDIFSLGVVLYQLLAGDLTHPATMDWPRHIDSELLRDDLSKCLAGDPQDRFAGAQQLAKRLRTLPERRLELSRRDAEIAAREKAAQRRGMMRATAGAAIIIIIMAALAIYAGTKSLAAKREAVESENQRRLARNNFERAQKSLDDLMVLAEHAQSNSSYASEEIGTNKPLSLQLVNSAVNNYASFVKQSPNDPDLKANLGRLYERQSSAYFARHDFESRIIELYGTNSSYAISLGGKANPANEATAYEALKRSYETFDSLAAISTRMDYQNELANVCQSLGGKMTGAEGADYLQRALSIRENLVSADPDSVNHQINLASLLSTMTDASTNQSDKQRYSNRGIQIREHLEKTARGSENEMVRAAELAAAYEKRFDIEKLEGGQAERWIQIAVTLRTSLDTKLGGQPANSPDINTNELGKSENLLELSADFQRLTELLARHGEFDEALPAAQKWIQTAAEIPDGPETRNELLLAEAYSQSADIKTKLGLREGALADLEKASQNLQLDLTLQSITFLAGRLDEWQRLDAIWARKIDLCMDNSDFSRAIATANGQKDYWFDKEREYGLHIALTDQNKDQTFYSARVACAWWCVANVCRIAGHSPDAADAEIHAREIQQNMVRNDPSLLIEVFQALVRGYSDHSPDNTNTAIALSRKFREAYLGEAAEILETLALKTDLAIPAGFTSMPQLKLLQSRTNVSGLLASWAARSQPHPGTDVLVLAPETIRMLLAAAHNNQTVTVKGVVNSALRSNTGRTTTIKFAGLPETSFIAIVRTKVEKSITQKLGGPLGDVLPGATLTLTGKPKFFLDQLEIALEEPQQIAGFDRSTNSPGLKSLPAADGTIPAPGDYRSLDFAQKDIPEEWIDKNVIVEGNVRKAEWSKTGAVMNIELQGVTANRLHIVMFKGDAARFATALKGDPATILAGQSVRIRGEFTLFGKWFEIVITQPEQLTILPTPVPSSVRLEAPVSDGIQKSIRSGTVTLASETNNLIEINDTAALLQQTNKEVIVEGTIQQASWSGTGAVLNIEYQGVPPHGLLAVLLRSDSDAITAALKGDPAAILQKKQVRIKGTMVLYGGRSAAFKGRPQIMIRQSDQITILDSPPSPENNDAAK